MERIITYAKALSEATDLCMAKDDKVYIMGLGVPDPSGFFGTTIGLQEKYGKMRAMDMPTSENGMTGGNRFSSNRNATYYGSSPNGVRAFGNRTDNKPSSKLALHVWGQPMP